MVEFIAVNDSLRSCNNNNNNNNNNNKTKAEISGLSLDYFQGRVWLGMASLCELFLCVIVGNFITC